MAMQSKDFFVEENMRIIEDAETERRQDENNAWREEAEKEHSFLKTVNEVSPSVATSEQLAQAMIDNIMDGNIDPLQFAVKRKCIEDAFDLVMKDKSVKDLMIEEVNKYGKQGATALGAKLSLTNRPTYEYKADAKWSEIKEKMAPLEAELKEQEEKIKMACKTNCNLVSDDGEIIASVVPAPATTSVNVSFKYLKRSCNACNSFIESNPDWATENGFLLSRFSPIDKI